MSSASDWNEWAKKNADRVHDQTAPAGEETYSENGSSGNSSPARPEATLQKHVIEWCNLRSGAYPPLQYIFATPNEGKRNRWRDWGAMGMRAGVPDLVLPYSSGPFGALYLELKAMENDVTPAQHRTIDMLIEAGNAADVAWTFEQATFVLTHYLESPETFLSGY